MSERNKGPADDLFNQEQGGTREDNLQPVGRMTIHYRAMGLDDVGQVPLDCHGSAEALAQRISDLGSAAILAFDGEQHVAQLQFRRHHPGLRSPSGIWHPDYWGDFGGRAPALPERTLGVFCFHVGQTQPGEGRDAAYQGRGIGTAMLDYLIGWAADNRFDAMIAKCTPDNRSAMAFMGGQAAATYISRGFALAETWVDDQLREALRQRNLIAATDAPANIGRVGMCVKPLSA